MALLISLVVAIALFAAFLMLTAFEARHRVRIMGGARLKLDRQVARVSFVASHVDWSAFIRQLVRNAVEIIAHDIAHTTLVVVRAIERFLTRVVRSLRTRRVERTEVSEPGKLRARISHMREVFRRPRAKKEEDL